MSGALPSLTRSQRLLLAVGLLVLALAGLTLWQAYGLPVALISGGLMC